MNNHYRNGKIARLPQLIREEINQRLQAGHTGRSITVWLNSLAEVRATMDASFAGTEIREQNISEWKKGGYQEWLRFQEAVALAEHLYERGQEMKAMEKDRMPMSEVFTLWMTSRLAVSTREIESLKGEAAWRKQRQFCTDLMKIRHAEHQAEKLQIERERTELQRQKFQFQRDRAEQKRGLGKGDHAKAQTQPATGPNSNHFHQHTSHEEKIVHSLRPKNLNRLSPLLTEEQKEARWKEILHIPSPARAAA